MESCSHNRRYTIVDGQAIARRRNKHKGSRNQHMLEYYIPYISINFTAQNVHFWRCIERDKASGGLEMHINMNRRVYFLNDHDIFNTTY